MLMENQSLNASHVTGILVFHNDETDQCFRSIIGQTGIWNVKARNKLTQRGTPRREFARRHWLLTLDVRTRGIIPD